MSDVAPTRLRLYPSVVERNGPDCYFAIASATSRTNFGPR